MSAAAASATRSRSSKGHKLTPANRRLLLFGGATLLIVLMYVLAKRSSSTSTSNTTDPNAPYQDPTTGQWIDPTTGLPIGPTSTASDLGGGSSGVLPGANADPYSTIGDPYSLGPTPVQLVDAAGNPVIFPTASGDNGNAGTGSSTAPQPTDTSPTSTTTPPPTSTTAPHAQTSGVWWGGKLMTSFKQLWDFETSHGYKGTQAQFLSQHPAIVKAFSLPTPPATPTRTTAAASSPAPAPHAAVAAPVTAVPTPTPAPAPAAQPAHVPAAPPTPHVVVSGGTRFFMA